MTLEPKNESSVASAKVIAGITVALGTSATSAVVTNLSSFQKVIEEASTLLATSEAAYSLSRSRGLLSLWGSSPVRSNIVLGATSPFLLSKKVLISPLSH